MLNLFILISLSSVVFPLAKANYIHLLRLLRLFACRLHVGSKLVAIVFDTCIFSVRNIRKYL